jgi:hypothetical protein
MLYCCVTSISGGIWGQNSKEDEEKLNGTSNGKDLLRWL